MKLKLLSAMMFLVLTSPSFGSPIYNPATGHWYERVDDEVTWNTAKAAAEARGGYLAVITSSAENQWIVDNLGGAATLDHWLGAYRETAARYAWTWVNGESWSYTNWWPGEPNGGLTETALQFDDNEGNPPIPGYWNDMGLTAREPGYIVEYGTTPVPLPPSMLLFGSGLAGIVGYLRLKTYKRA